MNVKDKAVTPAITMSCTRAIQRGISTEGLLTACPCSSSSKAPTVAASIIPGNTLFQRFAVAAKMKPATLRMAYPRTREGWCPSEKFASVPKAFMVPQITRANQPQPSSHPPARRNPDFTCSSVVDCLFIRHLSNAQLNGLVARPLVFHKIACASRYNTTPVRPIGVKTVNLGAPSLTVFKGGGFGPRSHPSLSLVPITRRNSKAPPFQKSGRMGHPNFKTMAGPSRLCL
jgi:hypothetical protein